MAVIELRNYLLAPGRARDFMRYFEEHFLQSQRDHGMHPLGQFELVDEPDRFVWIREFEDMAARLRGLTGFYSSPFWLARRDAANAMIRDHENVHLLRPLAPVAGLTGGASPDDTVAAPAGSVPANTGLVVADFHRFPPAALGRALELFEQEVRPALLAGGHQVLGHFVAELAPNDYPRLAVIQDPGVLVVMTAYRDPQHLHDARREWGAQGLAGAWSRLTTGVTRMRLRPTARSLIRYRSGATPSRTTGAVRASSTPAS
jgi:quinol monooxygenase YgiN